MEIIIFISVFAALPVNAHIKKIRNGIYGLFATIPGKNITQMLATYSNIKKSYQLILEN